MLKPLQDRVLVQPLTSNSMSKGGLHIPQQAQERPIEGRVVAVGPGKRDDRGELHPVPVEVGSTVVFSKYSGTEVLIDGERMLVMSETDLLGTLA